MKKHLLSAFVLSAGSLMACATDAGMEEEEATSTSDDSESTGTTSSELSVASQVPRVLSRSASGSQLVFRFDRAVTAAEIPMNRLRVDVVRREAGQFKKSNVLGSAVLSPDGRTLTMNLTESIKRRTAYYARGTWRSCTSVPFVGQICKSLPAEFGQVITTAAKPVLVNGSILADFTQSANLAVFKKVSPDAAFDAGRVTHVVVAEPLASAPSVVGTTLGSFTLAQTLTGASVGVTVGQGTLVPSDMGVASPAPSAAPPGTFRVKSMTPIESSEANTRDLRTVTIQFEGGTIDCSRIALGEAGFKLYSRSPDLGAQQLMFDDPAGPNPTDPAYKGDLRCQEPENRVLFTTPGRLFGDVQYMIEANFVSKEGDTLRIEKDFYTERPGIRVLATRIENRYGTDDTCDSNGFFGSKNYCDIYVTSAIAGADNPQTARIPDSGNFSEMRFFDTDPIHGARDFSPAKVLFQSDKPVGVALELDLMAHDADSTTGWKRFLEVAGTIASNAGKAIAAVNPPVGAISAGVGEALGAISEAIPTNEDDKLGSAKYTVTREHSRWGTTHVGATVIPLDNAYEARGPVNVYVYFEEFPAPWRPAPIIL